MLGSHDDMMTFSTTLYTFLIAYSIRTATFKKQFDSKEKLSQVEWQG